MLRRDSATPRQYMSERFRMWDRMVLPHSVCRHQEFVKASRRESYGTHGTQVLTEPRMSAPKEGSMLTIDQFRDLKKDDHFQAGVPFQGVSDEAMRWTVVRIDPLDRSKTLRVTYFGVKVGTFVVSEQGDNVAWERL